LGVLVSESEDDLNRTRAFTRLDGLLDEALTRAPPATPGVCLSIHAYAPAVEEQTDYEVLEDATLCALRAGAEPRAA
jgi:hypothetical protein